MRRIVQSVTVRCGDEDHRVELRSDGTFVYRNHPHTHVRRYKLLAELGAEVPMCLHFYKGEDEHIYCPDIPEVQKNVPFRKAVQRIQWRRTSLLIFRKKRKEEPGLGKRIRGGNSVIALILRGKVPTPEPTHPKPKPPRFPAWVPTYLKPYQVYNLTRRSISDRRFKSLRSGHFRRPKAKIWWQTRKRRRRR